MAHTIRTTHIQALVAEAVAIAKELDGVEAGQQPIKVRGRDTLGIMALDRASNLLRHAAEELDDERMQCLGWDAV